MEKKGDYWVKRYFKTVEELIKLRSIHGKTLYELESIKTELECRKDKIQRLQTQIERHNFTLAAVTILFFVLLILIT